MGHAGAVISGGSGTAEAKLDAMREAGITVVDGPHLLGKAMKDLLARKPVKAKAPAPAAKPAAKAPPAAPKAPAKAARATKTVAKGAKKK